MRTRLAVHRSVLVVDVEEYGQEWRTTPHRLTVRKGLDLALRRAFDDTGLPWADCRVDDCGDGAFVLIPPQVPKALLTEALPYALADALRQHNRRHAAEERIRLRMALHAGEVAFDDRGVTAPAINRAFRLLDAEPVRRALRDSPGVLVVTVKETVTTGWLCCPDHPYASTGRPH